MTLPTDIASRLPCQPQNSTFAIPSSRPLGKGMTWADDEKEKDQTNDNRGYEIEQKVAGL
jgi:hypothetical protein